MQLVGFTTQSRKCLSLRQPGFFGMEEIALYVLPFTSEFLKVLKSQDLIKLLAFSALSRTFLSETGMFLSVCGREEYKDS